LLEVELFLNDVRRGIVFERCAGFELLRTWIFFRRYGVVLGVHPRPKYFEPTSAFLQPFVTPAACKLAVYVTSSLAVRYSLVDTRKFGVESWVFS
jgi:hypothetical protein